MIRRIFNVYRFTKSERKSLILLSSILVLVNGFGLVIKSDDYNDHSNTESINNNSYYDIPEKPAETISIQKPVDISFNATQDQQVEINTADSIELMGLYGIGPSFAGRIIKYRNLLGGYYSCSQLLEVYGMDSLRYNGFKSKIFADKSGIRKMNLNTYGFRDFLRHPYLDYESVKKLISYRDRNGPFKTANTLWADSVLGLELKDKLMPYLIVN